MTFAFVLDNYVERTEELVRFVREHGGYYAEECTPETQEFYLLRNRYFSGEVELEAYRGVKIAYHNVPSVTHFPVYLGNFGDLFEPFCDGLSDEEWAMRLKELEWIRKEEAKANGS